MTLGGAQRIPRPPDWRPGDPRPWAGAIDTAAFFESVRSRYTGRVGRPAAVEGRPGVRRSAVLAAWYVRDDEPHVLCTRRSWNLRTHRGEVSFPGGGEEPGDPTLHHTALREAWEEVGLDPASVEVLGELDHLTTVTSDRFIVPVVGLLEAPPPALVPQEAEVEQILEVPLSALLHPEAFREERWDSFGLERGITFFEIEGDTIWGATGAMLHQFLRSVLPPATG